VARSREAWSLIVRSLRENATVPSPRSPATLRPRLALASRSSPLRVLRNLDAAGRGRMTGMSAPRETSYPQTSQLRKLREALK
jgi:hypothetical protein